MTDEPTLSLTSSPDTADLRSPSSRLWPTPQSHDAQGPKTPEQVARMRARGFGVRNLNEEVLSAPSASPRSIPTPAPSSRTDSPMSPTSAPFSQSPEIQSLSDAVSCRLSSLVAFLASRTPSPASEAPSSTHATFGMSASECFGIYDPALPSSRTLRDSSPPVAIPMPRMVSSAQDFFSTAYVQTWPRFGTLANGKLYRQPTLELPTAASASGSSVSMNSDWPTPAVFDTTGGPYPTELTPEGFRSYHNGVPHGTKLSDAVRVEPTRPKGEKSRSGPPRTDSGLPVPASDSTGGSRAESWATPRTITGGAESAQRKQELGRTESGGGDLQSQVTGKLNPSWVETLQGVPMGHTQLPRKFVKPKQGTP